MVSYSESNDDNEDTIINLKKYPWITDLTSIEARNFIETAKLSYQTSGAVVLHDFLTEEALQQCIQDARKEEDDAYTTDDTHTPYLTSIDTTNNFSINSITNYEMRTRVASIAYDELPSDSPLVQLYQHPLLLPFISQITSSSSSSNQPLFLSEDPIGACSINVFRPNYYHSFHFDESEFSTTIMIQEAETGGYFQYTPPLRQSRNDLALSKVATTIHTHHTTTTETNTSFPEQQSSDCPELHTLDFRPGTLSIFSGSKSLHRVTQVKGSKSRLVAVLTFATQPGFKNSKQVQELFWGRSSN